MKLDGYTRLAAVVANPIKHSISPFIHNRAFEATATNGVYVAWEIEAVDLAETVANIRRYQMFGINLSMPYKEQVIPYLDELGEDLHYDLLFYYLNVFLFNSEKSQLIITSQETALLQQDLINENRGVVWFVEKNRETASSEYNRGDSYGLHKNLSLYNSYRIGRLGAKPELGSIFVNLEE